MTITISNDHRRRRHGRRHHLIFTTLLSNLLQSPNQKDKSHVMALVLSLL